MKRILAVIMSMIIVIGCFSGCSIKTEEVETISFDLENTYDSIYSDFDASTIRAYNDVCSAIINGEQDVRINLSMLEDIQQLLYTSFPLVYLVKDISHNDDNSGISLTYKNEIDEHKQLVSEFNKKIKSIENECGYSTASNSLYTLNVYQYVSSHIKISSNMSVSLFETVMNGEGSVFTYSNLFEYLLLQKGIKAFHVIASDAKGAGWALSSAEINNGIYYFDVASEYYANNGNNINYFAMNYKDVENEGLNSLHYTSQGKAFKSKDNEFKACRSCKKWSVDGSKLKIVQYDLEEISIDLN